jgi:hypothetical protein
MRTRRDAQEDLWPDFEAIFEGIQSFLVDSVMLIGVGTLIYGVAREFLPH